MGMIRKAAAECQDSVTGLILTKYRLLNALKMCSHFFPGHPVPVLDSSLGEDIVSNIQPKPPWGNWRPYLPGADTS